MAGLLQKCFSVILSAAEDLDSSVLRSLHSRRMTIFSEKRILQKALAKIYLQAANKSWLVGKDFAIMGIRIFIFPEPDWVEGEWQGLILPPGWLEKYFSSHLEKHFKGLMFI